MSMISLAAMPAGTDIHSTDVNFKTILLMSCIGLLASFGLMAAGVDISAAFV
jgi:hypothetical protein